MTDNDDELMPIEDALRIIMKVPPKQPAEGPTADGDDQVEPDEESSC